MTEKVYSRECHSRFVLSRLKCTFKGNRKRRCNFPRETEHEIKRRRDVHPREPPCHRCIRSPFPHYLVLFLSLSLAFCDTSRFIFPFGCPRHSSTGFNDNLAEREVPLPLLLSPFFSTTSCSPFLARNPLRTIRGGIGEVFRAISRAGY